MASAAGLVKLAPYLPKMKCTVPQPSREWTAWPTFRNYLSSESVLYPNLAASLAGVAVSDP